MSEGFNGYPEWTPDYQARLDISFDIETHSRPNDKLGIMETEPSGRRRMVIEGETEFVDAILAAALPAINKARAEIGD